MERSFDEFFTRTLRPGIHVIDEDDQVAVSPVDGRILNYGQVSDGHIDQIKGRNYTISELLDSTEMAEKFKDGHYVTLYLSPRDYHRIHSPIEGKVTGFRYVPGRLYPVNQMGVNNVDRLFAVNERLITYINSALGRFAVIKVGATNVGMITASYHSIRTNEGAKTAFNEQLKHAVPIDKGEELGQFHLGSTVIVLTERDDVIPVDIREDDTMRMGQRLFVRTSNKAK